MKLRIAWAVLAFSAIAFVCAGVAVAAAPSPFESTARSMIATGVPGVVVIAKHDRRETRVALGVDLLSKHRPMLSSDRFRVGSVTKSFVATVVLQLVHDHRIALNDSVERWLPGLVPGGKGITVHQLLQHTSGLYDYAADPATFAPFATDPAHAWKPRELVAIATGHEPAFAPGKGWGYSNTNYVLLGLIVEAATGNPIGVELNKRILQPLHLWGTSFDTTGRYRDAANGRHRARFAHGYTDFGSGRLDASDLNPSWGYAAGALSSTAGDLIAFYTALMQGKLIDRASLAAMRSAVPLGNGSGYGLGLLRLKTKCGDFWGHDGGTFGYSSLALVSSDGRRSASVLVNWGRLSPRQETLLQQLAEEAACS